MSFSPKSYPERFPILHSDGLNIFTEVSTLAARVAVELTRYSGSMTNIGGGEGLVDAPMGKLKGRLAWLAWRS